ncbi:MAG: hypothetical protein QG659_593 [Patescibacteria group bacterium]|jgi:adenylate kinase family enzyme|nr:hypothetical protein [Patescibacteria group bacterium]
MINCYSFVMSKVVILTGTSGSGKSSTSKVLSGTLPGTWALISQDDIRELVKAGYKSAAEEWTDDTKNQWEVSIDICCDMIKRYHQYDINCILEMFAPPSEFEKWKPKLNGIDYQLFVLMPNLETTLERHRGRKGKMTEEQIRENHEWFTSWQPDQATIIDPSNQTLEETVAFISQSISK